jgi:type III secretion protein J
VLVERGFKADKVPEKGKKPTWAIEVDEDHATDAMRVLTELKLPRPARATTKSLMQSNSLIETPTAERLRQLEAQEGDLEEALEGMDGVTSVSVELVVPAPPRPGMPAIPSKASVLMRVRPEATERMQQQRAELRALVAGAVDGLKLDDVVLVIDAVTLKAPEPEEKPADHLRVLLISMSVALTLVAALVMVLAWRLRRARVRHTGNSPPQPERTEKSVVVSQPPPQRPVVSAGVQRKVA